MVSLHATGEGTNQAAGITVPSDFRRLAYAQT